MNLFTANRLTNRFLGLAFFVMFVFAMYWFWLSDRDANRLLATNPPVGLIETQCVEGYKYTVAPGGQTKQIIDEEGKGVPCN